MEWINIEDSPLPKPDKYISGYSIPVISKLYGFGFVVKGFYGGWSFTTDHKNYTGLSHITHWMHLPVSPPK